MLGLWSMLEFVLGHSLVLGYCSFDRQNWSERRCQVALTVASP